MKKLAIVAVATMFCAVGAFGVSITVPFFLDNAPADSTFPPSEDTASFIGIRNITDSEILVAVEYFDANAEEDVTPAENTFTLMENEGISFRPSVQDEGTEGAGARVPIMTQGQAGAVTISWEGQPGEIIGRAVQIDSDGNVYGFGLGLGDAQVAEEEEGAE